MTLKVKLLEYSPNPEKIIATAAKLCYSVVRIEQLEKIILQQFEYIVPPQIEKDVDVRKKYI